MNGAFHGQSLLFLIAIPNSIVTFGALRADIYPKKQFQLDAVLITVARIWHGQNGTSLIIKKRARETNLTPKTVRGIDKLAKASLFAKNSHILACRDLGTTRLAESMQMRRRAQKNIQLQSGGIIDHSHSL